MILLVLTGYSSRWFFDGESRTSSWLNADRWPKCNHSKKNKRLIADRDISNRRSWHWTPSDWSTKQRWHCRRPQRRSGNLGGRRHHCRSIPTIPSRTQLKTSHSKPVTLKIVKGKLQSLRTKTGRSRSWKEKHVRWTDLQREGDTLLEQLTTKHAP